MKKEQSAKHIVIITGQHMVANPRVWKESNTLAENGYRVTILTTLYDTSKVEQDKYLLHPCITYKAVLNMSKGVGSFQDVYLSRLLKKIALLRKKYLKKDSVALLLYLPRKQIKMALVENADLYIAHQEAGLMVGVELAKRGKKVAFDFEDWYSCDFLNAERPINLLQKAELFAIQNASYITCPSEAMANAITDCYQSKQKIQVIYNGFSCKENCLAVLKEKDTHSLIWFSQVVGTGRGLETILKALALCSEPVHIHIAGLCHKNYQEELQQYIQGTFHKITFYEQMKHMDLIPFLSNFNIALALENDFPESRNTTITNKIFQYIQAGNKILATNTKGQAEFSESFKDGIALVDVNQPKQWAAALLSLINSPTINQEQRLQDFNRHFAWEAQEKKIIELVKKAIC